MFIINYELCAIENFYHVPKTNYKQLSHQISDNIFAWFVSRKLMRKEILICGLLNYSMIVHYGIVVNESV